MVICKMLCLRCTENRLKENKEGVIDGAAPSDTKNDRIAEIEKRFAVLEKNSSFKCNVCQDCGCRMYFFQWWNCFIEMEVVDLGEVLILHLGHNDDNLWHKLVDLLGENGYQINHMQKEKRALNLLKFDGLEIVPERHQVFLENREVILTGKEFQILLLLAQNRGRVFSKE